MHLCKSVTISSFHYYKGILLGEVEGSSSSFSSSSTTTFGII
jgi:hypothetical protein